MLIAFPVALALTILIEGIVYWLYLRKTGSFAYAGIISGTTLPLLWFFSIKYYFPSIELFGEIIVFMIETVMIRKLVGKDWVKSAEISAVSNLASYTLGIVLYFL